MSFFKRFQLITPEQFQSLSLTNDGESKESTKYLTDLNGRTYHVLKNKDKHYISRKPQSFSEKWMSIEEFHKTIDPEHRFIRQDRDLKTKSGNDMFDMIHQEIKYVGITTSKGDFISKENQLNL